VAMYLCQLGEQRLLTSVGSVQPCTSVSEWVICV
jgi:hypothetical protein